MTHAFKLSTQTMPYQDNGYPRANDKVNQFIRTVQKSLVEAEGYLTGVINAECTDDVQSYIIVVRAEKIGQLSIGETTHYGVRVLLEAAATMHQYTEERDKPIIVGAKYREIHEFDLRSIPMNPIATRKLAIDLALTLIEGINEPYTSETISTLT